MKWLVAAALMLVAFSGCLEGGLNDDSPGGADAPVDSTDGPVGEAASGTPVNHGEPTIEEGPEETHAPDTNSPWWEVRQTITIDNDFGGAALSDISLATDIGGMDVAPSPDGDYHYTLLLVGGGGTQQEAQAAFDRISWEHTDALDDGVLSLTTWIDADVEGGGSCQGIGPLAQCTGQYWRGFITALIPDSPAHDIEIDGVTADFSVEGLGGSALGAETTTGDGELDNLDFGIISIDTTTGDMDLSALRCGELTLSSTTGDADIDGLTALRVTTDTDTGDLSVDAATADSWTHGSDTGDFDADGAVVTWALTTNTGDFAIDGTTTTLAFQSNTGDFNGDLKTLASGALTFVTQTGEIGLDLPPGSGVGYDVDARTQTGDINVDVSNGETLADEDDHVHMRTNGFANAGIQTTVDIDTNTGDITVDA